MISTSVDYATTLAREVIFPKWKLLSYNALTDSWAKIIDGTHVQTPVDLTPYVTRIEYSFDRLTVSMTDDASLAFHPDGGALSPAISPGRILRLQEGFEGLAAADWLWTFSGTVESSYSWVYQRVESVGIQFTVYNRGNNQAFKRRNVSSRAYTIGSDWSAMFMNIVKDVMLLSDTEVVVPEPWGVLFDKNSNQVVNMPPWDAMEQLTLGIQARPWFNGKGELALYSTTQNRVDVTLTHDKTVRRYEARIGNGAVNKVVLRYLSNSLFRVNGPDQLLGTAMVTTGFFRPSQSMEVYYSDEHKTRSDNPRFIVRQSVNSGLLPVGTEVLTQLDEFHVRIDVHVEAYVQALIAYLFAMYLLLSVVPFDIGFGLGTVTVSAPFGRIQQAIVLIVILIVMSSIGTGQYEVWGIPYEMVYLEQQVIAIKADTEFWQERELEIRNDFISTVEQAQTLVLGQLNYEVMKDSPRTLLLRYDPRIEPGDIIQLSTTTRIYVEGVQRQIARANTDNVIMTVTGFRTVL